MNKIQDSTNVQLPPVIQFELEELGKLMTQLDETPALANDYRFQDKVKTVITLYSSDFTTLDVDQKNFLYDLNLDLMEAHLITLDPYGSSVGAPTGNWETCLTQLVDPEQPVNWIEVMILPAINVALGSDASASLQELAK
jgi:hypothetical protein